MMVMITEGLLAVLVGFFVLYVALEVRAVRRAGCARGTERAAVAVPSVLPDGLLPKVSVLLPVRDEEAVVGRLVDTVCALDYPADRLEILLLDDSEDGTTAIAEARVAYHRSLGVPVRYARRKTHEGYKAGNLAFGLGLAGGDFIAVFDADCLPPSDFLRRVMPCFQDEEIGFLQTAVGFANAGGSFLTRFQAMEAGHKEDVTSGLSRDGFMASLTGSSCVWRRACIEAVGGISADTITEDVDMGYRAQLRAWRYVFLGDVVSLAELPETVGAFRVQRQRWARGLVHNALRHARGVMAASMPVLTRLYAVALVFSSVLLASLYLLLLLCLPVAMETASYGPFFHACCTVFLLAAIVWAWCNTSGPGRDGPSVPLRSRIVEGFGYVLMFFPLSLYYFTAAVQVLSGSDEAFHRTPKGCGCKDVPHPPINAFLLRCEVLSLLYALAALAIGLEEGNYWVTLYTGLAIGGFTMTLSFSWIGGRRSAPRHVCITGATGALGSALALEYAAPGVRLTLHGRRVGELERLAGMCRAKGATVDTAMLDLRRTDDVRRWADGLCADGVPDLLIANAGLNTNIGPDAEGEPFDEVEALVEVNLLANMALVDGVLPAMRRKGRGQIAIVSSLAGYYGLPSTPAYCATKAALRTWGHSLRGWLRSEGIRVNVILPGYVFSPMCDAMPGPKPFLWRPERAARTIRRGLESDLARISFPFPLNLGIWLLALLPACLAMPIARLFGYGR